MTLGVREYERDEEARRAAAMIAMDRLAPPDLTGAFWLVVLVAEPGLGTPR